MGNGQRKMKKNCFRKREKQKSDRLFIFIIKLFINND